MQNSIRKSNMPAVKSGNPFTLNQHLCFVLRCLFLFAFASCFTSTALAQVSGDYQSNSAGITWESATGWQSWNGTSWITAVTAPNAATFSNNTVTVKAGHTVTFANTYTFAAGNTFVFESGAILDFAGAASNTLSINGTTIFKDFTATQVRPGNSSSGGNNQINFGSGATIQIYNNNGIAGTNCTFLSSYNKLNVTFNNAANWIISGNASQVTTGLPGTVNALTINNASGVALSAATTASAALTLTAGILNTTTNNITLGTGATITRSGGSLSAIPVFGTTVNVTYAQHTSAITTGNELPATTTILNNLTVNTSNGVNLNAARTVNGTITLTNGIFDLGANLLTSVKSSAPFSGGSSGAYIRTSGAGAIKTPVANAATVIFPVGNSTYNPLSIKNNTGTADNFAIIVLDQVYANGASGALVANPRVIRTWNITKTTANGGTGIDFIFNWNGGETSGSLTTPGMYHYSAGWSRQTGGVTTSPTGTSLSYTGYTGTLSPFAVMDNIPLPITWLSFTTQKKDKSVLLNWSTASEQNALDYTIQHSTDGINWYNIGTVAAVGTSSAVSAYSFTHTAPGKNNNYYRLLQKDINGRVSFSKTESVTFNTDKLVLVYPQIVTDGQINIQTPQPAAMNIYSSNGTLMLSKKLAAGTESVTVSNLSKGFYLVKVGNETIRFIIE